MSAPRCRSCDADALGVFLSLGKMPLANGLLTSESLHAPEPLYPLDVALCESCGLVQLTTSVPPNEMFDDYPYFSSMSTTMVEHARAIAGRLVKERHLGSDDLVLEIASNDGYLLQHYRNAAIPVLGVDPAANIAVVAEKNGIPTVVDYFGTDLADRLVAQGKKASVVHANNVLAHVPDINGVVRGIAAILRGDGVAVIETPYVRDLVEALQFDTIYNEHLFYYSLTALVALFARNGLTVVDVERLAIHGGSLRLFVEKSGIASQAVRDMLDDEARDGVADAEYYRDFATRVEAACARLRAVLHDLKSRGLRIGAYGAAAKGAVLLNAAGIGVETIDFVCDRSEYKQGKFMPGVRIPIVDPDQIAARMPDVVVLLVWNVAAEILSQQSGYVAAGGRFLIPGAEPRFLPEGAAT